MNKPREKQKTEGQLKRLQEHQKRTKETHLILKYVSSEEPKPILPSKLEKSGEQTKLLVHLEFCTRLIKTGSLPTL